MSKTSSRWEQFLLINPSQTKTKDWYVLALSSKQVSQITRKGLVALSLISLWWWNWQLLLATGTGIGLMWLTYKIPRKRYRRLWQKFSGLVTGQNRRLMLAVFSGSIGGLFTYAIANVWADAENRWLVTGSILQGLGTLITLILLAWYINRDSERRNEDKFDRLVGDLTANDSLKRSIAIRQLTKLGCQNNLDRLQKLHLIEYFYLMLARPQESVIQEALLDSLELLGATNLSVPQSPVTATPIRLKHPISENVL